MAEYGESLSERELDVLEQVMQGAANKEIAQILSISPNTVKVHLRNIYTKLGVSSRTEASMAALEQGLIDSADIFDTPLTENGQASAEDEEDKEGPDEADENTAVAESPLPAVTPTPTLANEIDTFPEVPRRNWRWVILSIVAVVLTLGGVFYAGILNAPTDDENGLTNTTTSPPFSPIEIEPSWLRSLPMPEPRAGMASITSGVDVYQIGGRVDGEIVDTVTVYNTNTTNWRTAADKPTAVTDATAAEALQIYVPGGLTAAGEPTDIVEAYSPATDSWRVVQSLPKPVASGLALSNGSAIYLFGGWDGQNYLADAYVYDPATNAWSQLADMQHARAGAAGGVINGQLYVVGGFDGEQNLDVCEYYDPETDLWAECKPLGQPRRDAGAAVVLNKLYILGGQSEGDIYGELYNPADEIWQIINIPELSDENMVGWQNPAVTNVEARIFIQGGTLSDSTASDTVLIYAPPVYQTFIPAASSGDE